jgi:hypothetical protein
MQVTVNVPEEWAQQALGRGLAVEAYVEEALVREPQHSAPKDLRVVGAIVALL